MSQQNEQFSSSESNLQRAHCFLEKQFSSLIDKHTQLTLEQSFHLEYCKLYLQNINLKSQIQKVKQQLLELKQLYPTTFRHKLFNQLSQDCSNSEKKRRIRRTANQIARHYICKVQKCQKTYGSEGSLNQHIKLKHKGISNHH